MSRFALGPSFGIYTEPGAPSLGDAKIDNLRVAPGGNVIVTLFPNDPAFPTNRPKTIYALYIDPSALPPVEQRTGQWFMDSPALRGSVDVSALPSGDVSISVPGIQPGSLNHIQIVSEFDS